MARFCKRHRYTGRVDPELLADRLRTNLLSAAPGTVAGRSHSALVFAELPALLTGQLADYDDAIALAVQHHPDAAIFANFPGVGPIGVATLLAEIGDDRGHYPTPNTLLAEAGLAPVTRAPPDAATGPLPLRRQQGVRCASMRHSVPSRP